MAARVIRNPGPDVRLRRLERRAATGDRHAEAELLRHRVRIGTLGRLRLELAAHLGYPPAGEAVGWRNPEPPYSSPDLAMVDVSRDPHLAVLWAWAAVDATKEVWEGFRRWHDAMVEADRLDFPLGPGELVMPDRILRFLGRWAWEEDAPFEKIPLEGIRSRIQSIQALSESVAWDEQEPEGATRWLEALHHALVALRYRRSRPTPSSRRSWFPRGTREPGGGVRRRTVSLNAISARRAHRSAAWAHEFYYYGTAWEEGRALDNAQFVVDREIRRLLVPELLA